jgi:hypothetical protein
MAAVLALKSPDVRMRIRGFLARSRDPTGNAQVRFMMLLALNQRVELVPLLRAVRLVMQQRTGEVQKRIDDAVDSMTDERSFEAHASLIRRTRTGHKRKTLNEAREALGHPPIDVEDLAERYRSAARMHNEDMYSHLMEGRPF